MFTVTGYLDDVAYTVTVGGGGPPAAATAGCAATSPAMAGWLTGQEGQPYKVTPTGPFGVTDLADPGSVLGTLIGHTKVTSVEGGAPDLAGPAQPGAEY